MSSERLFSRCHVPPGHKAAGGRNESDKRTAPLPSFYAYTAKEEKVRKGPPPGLNWYGPYHPTFTVVPSQFYPNHVPQRVRCEQVENIDLVVAQWRDVIKDHSLDGVPSADRKSIVYDFPPKDPTGPWYSSCRLTAVPGLIGGYYSQQWEFVYGFNTLALSVNYKWGPFVIAPQNEPIEAYLEELGNGLETNLGIIIGLMPGIITPTPWSEM